MLPEFINQYQVNDDDLKHLLLSHWASLCPQGYESLESCFGSLRCARKNDDNKPLKFSIANGLVIDLIPDSLKFKDKDDETKN